jgi:Prophage CP4-57 regulatory protein (AlpA)
MRTAKFREHLADIEAPPTEQLRSADEEVFITYNQLPDHGLPRYSRVHMRRLMARGLFPRPVMLSPNRIAWRKSDLAAWKASRPIAPLPVEQVTAVRSNETHSLASMR